MGWGEGLDCESLDCEGGAGGWGLECGLGWGWDAGRGEGRGDGRGEGGGEGGGGGRDLFEALAQRLVDVCLVHVEQGIGDSLGEQAHAQRPRVAHHRGRHALGVGREHLGGVRG